MNRAHEVTESIYKKKLEEEVKSLKIKLETTKETAIASKNEAELQIKTLESRCTSLDDQLHTKTTGMFPLIRLGVDVLIL